MNCPIEQVPNIGKVLGSRLRAVGISTAEDLKRVGDTEAFARIRESLPDDACRHTRLALAGAIEGVRHFALTPEQKAQALNELG